MICHSCQAKDHERCPEIARQSEPGLSAVDRAGGQLCDCQHVRAAPEAVSGDT